MSDPAAARSLAAPRDPQEVEQDWVERRWADLFSMIQRAQAEIPGASEQALVSVRFIAEDLQKAHTELLNLYAALAAPSEEEAALALVRRKLDYYAVTHTSQCSCMKDWFNHLLEHCDCETGRAIKALEVALRRKP